MAREYLALAEETIDVLTTIESRAWMATTKYYAEYFAAYAFLLRIGIRSEIHECTIVACQRLEQAGFLPSGTAERLVEDKRLRIENQYYVRHHEVPFDRDELLAFLLEIKDRILRLTPEEIDAARGAVSQNL